MERKIPAKIITVKDHLIKDMPVIDPLRKILKRQIMKGKDIDRNQRQEKDVQVERLDLHPAKIRQGVMIGEIKRRILLRRQFFYYFLNPFPFGILFNII